MLRDETIQRVLKFRDDRDWHQFHTPKDLAISMVDTGGIEFDESNHILRSMRDQAQIAIEEADVILFLVDGRAGLTTADEEVAKLLRKAHKPVILAVNKIDSPQRQMDIYEFYQLGLGDPIGLSASNAMNLGDGGVPDADEACRSDRFGRGLCA